jgi:hypothetical protein
MATRRSKLPSPGTGGGIITKTLMKLGSGLKNTPGALYRAITGGPREQTYGHIADLWPAKKRYKRKTNRISYVDRQTSTATAIPPMPGMDTEEILDLMKRNFEQEKRYREVQRSFDEERAGEEQERHEELIKALKDFTGTGTATPVANKEKKGGFLDSILDMFKAFEDKIRGMIDSIRDGISFLKNADLLGKLMTFLRSPIFGLLSGPLLMVGAILSLAYLLKKFVDIVPDMSVLSPEEAKSVLENGSERDIEKFGGREKLMEIAVGGKEQAQRILDTTPELTVEERARYEKIASATVIPQTPTQLGNTVPRNVYGGGGPNAQKEWDAKFGDRWNPDGTPKVQTTAKPLPQGVEAATDASRADAAATDPRRLDLPTGAAFGVRPMGIKAAPLPPPPSPVSRVTEENMDLAVNTNPMGDTTGGLLVQQNDLGTTKNEGPLPTTATQRDDEPMAAIVFRTQRRKAKAY